MNEPVPFTSPIAPLITRYLAMKRALGRSAVTLAYTLRYLDRFLVSRHAADLTRETFMAWNESMTCAAVEHALGATPRRLSPVPVSPA